MAAAGASGRASTWLDAALPALVGVAAAAAVFLWPKPTQLDAEARIMQLVDRAEAVRDFDVERYAAQIARGGAGFGYDPLFVPDGHTASYAELGDEVKNRISHRGVAMSRLLTLLREA